MTQHIPSILTVAALLAIVAAMAYALIRVWSITPRRPRAQLLPISPRRRQPNRRAVAKPAAEQAEFFAVGEARS